MRARLTRVGAALAAVAALAFGGAALAGATGQTPRPPAAQTGAQQGEQTGADNGTEPTESSSESTSDESAPESVESASESAAANDGPGGHADEPGNPSADHQFQGEE